MTRDLSLLLPDWQGCHSRPDTRAATLQIVEHLFDVREFVVIRAADEAESTREGGVYCLAGIVEQCRETLAVLARHQPDRLFTVGATCGVEIAPVGYLNERYAGDLAVVWLDAHADLNTPASSPSGNFHGMALRTLMGDGPAPLWNQLARPLIPRQVFLAGTRDLDPPEATFIERSGVSVTWRHEVDDPAVLVARIRASGCSRVYLHLDVDVFDPACFPDALMHAPGGPSIEEVTALVRAVAAAFAVVGFSVVEFVPQSPDAFDRLTSLLAASPIEIGAMTSLRR